MVLCFEPGARLRHTHLSSLSQLVDEPGSDLVQRASACTTELLERLSRTRTSSRTSALETSRKV